MINSNVQQLNNTTPSFGSRLPLNYKTAEKIVKEFSNQCWQSATYLNDIRYAGTENFLNDYHKGLSMLKTAEAHTGIMRYRRQFASAFKCKDNNDYMEILTKIIEKVKMLNCGESAQLVHHELNKLGIPNRMVSDKRMDHVFIVVNRTKPFTNYKDGKSGEFVADLWLKKVYKSVNEAYVDFKRLFKANPKNELEDITDVPFKYSTMRPLTEKEKLSNEATFEKVLKNIDLLKHEVKCEAKTLKLHTNHIQGRNKGQLKQSFVDDFEEALNRAEINNR